jgi:hypothetical protein
MGSPVERRRIQPMAVGPLVAMGESQVRAQSVICQASTASAISAPAPPRPRSRNGCCRECGTSSGQTGARRSCAVVLWSGTRRFSSHITSTLRAHSRSRRRDECTPATRDPTPLRSIDDSDRVVPGHQIVQHQRKQRRLSPRLSAHVAHKRKCPRVVVLAGILARPSGLTQTAHGAVFA